MALRTTQLSVNTSNNLKLSIVEIHNNASMIVSGKSDQEWFVL